MLSASAGQGCFIFRGANLLNGSQNELKGGPILRNLRKD